MNKIESAIQEFILDSQICLEVDGEFVREIFAAGAKWQRKEVKLEQESQQPIAWMNNQGETAINEVQVEYWSRGGYQITPLYAAPSAQVEQVPAVSVPDFESWWISQPTYKNDDKLASLKAWRACAAMLSTSPAPTKERSPQDYAIEHAEYMAVNGERLIEYLNEISDVDEGVLVPDDRFGDCVQGLRCGIHDFRKRAARCQAVESPAPDSEGDSENV